MLEVLNLQCERGNRILFSNLTFKLYPQQMLLLQGANGSGKTSLLRILAGISEASKGRISWQQKSRDKAFNNDMLYISHKPGIRKELTVLENIELLLTLFPCEGHHDLENALSILELSKFKDTQCGELSAGQQRRVALTRLLLSNAKLWLLDEPFTSLDKDGIVLLETIMQKHLSSGGMVVMASHHEPKILDVEILKLELGLMMSSSTCEPC